MINIVGLCGVCRYLIVNSQFLIDLFMKQGDYYVAYYAELEKRVEAFLWDFGTRLGDFDIKKPLQMFLCDRLSLEWEEYYRRRQQGLDTDAAMQRIDRFFSAMRGRPVREYEDADPILTDIRLHPWHEVLDGYKGVILVYVSDAGQFQYLLPLLRKFDAPALLLSEYDLPEDTDLPDCLTAMTMEFSPQRVFRHPVFAIRYPLLFHYANTFDILLRLLCPCTVLCLEGSRWQEQLLAVVASVRGVPSCCMQQGWPSAVQTGFRDMPFRYCFTWGERFSALWQAANLATRFIPCGYPYDTACCRQTPRDSVAFFLPTPCRLFDADSFNQLLELISRVAYCHSDVTFLVREHPDYQLKDAVRNHWADIPNIRLVTDVPLSEVYARARVVVAYHVSALTECLLYGCVPLAFIPTSHFSPCPDIEQNGWGYVAHTMEELTGRLRDILGGVRPRTAFENTPDSSHEGDAALKQIMRFLNNKSTCQ